MNCFACGTIERVEHHHIIPTRAGGKGAPGMRNNADNLVYLCKEHHHMVHALIRKRYGRNYASRGLTVMDYLVVILAIRDDVFMSALVDVFPGDRGWLTKGCLSPDFIHEAMAKVGPERPEPLQNQGVTTGTTIAVSGVSDQTPPANYIHTVLMEMYVGFGYSRERAEMIARKARETI